MSPAELARLFQSEAPKLVRRLASFRGRVAAEDVVQTAFTKMMELEETEMKDPKAYLAQLVRNLAINEARRYERSPVTFLDPESSELSSSTSEAPSPEDMLIAGQRFGYMMGIVLALPEKERQALMMAKMGGLSHREIGARMGVSHRNVARYLERALAKCHAALKDFDAAWQADTQHAPSNDAED